MPPPQVVDGALNPVDPTKIGNGTVANVKVWQRDYDIGGRKGISSKLDAVQVVEMKEYIPQSGFDVMAVQDVSHEMPSAPEGFDPGF